MRKIANIMQSGDEVCAITAEIIAIQRVNGEVDIYALERTEEGMRIGDEPEMTIGFEDIPEIEYETEKHVKIISF